MFTKDSKPKGDNGSGPQVPKMGGAPQAVSATPSIISADLKITGNLKSNGDIQIDGRIEGDVDSKSVTIGESAEVNGIVSCERVRVCGAVSGEIRAQSVVLARSAKVDGDVVHNSLEIEAGASLQGGVRRLGSETKAKPQPQKQKEEKAEADSSDNVSKITDAKAAQGNAAAL